MASSQRQASQSTARNPIISVITDEFVKAAIVVAVPIVFSIVTGKIAPLAAVPGVLAYAIGSTMAMEAHSILSWNLNRAFKGKPMEMRSMPTSAVARWTSRAAVAYLAYDASESFRDLPPESVNFMKNIVAVTFGILGAAMYGMDRAVTRLDQASRGAIRRRFSPGRANIPA